MGNKWCGPAKRRRGKEKPKISASAQGSTQNVAHSASQPSAPGEFTDIRPTIETEPVPESGNDSSSQIAGTQSDVQQDSQPSKFALPDYHIWYRHTGKALPSDDWLAQADDRQKRNEQEIREDVGEHYITHMCINGILSIDIYPLLNDIAPKLTHLWILSVEDDDPSQLESLRELKELKILILQISNFSFYGLPRVIGELKSLTELRIRHCRLTDLPDDLSKLKQLKVLHLVSNDFSNGLPNVVGELTSLTELYIDSCGLTDLPDNFEELKMLKVLTLTDAKFKRRPPDVIGELSSLTELHIRCRLRDLPKKLGELQQLEVLDLENNYFSDGLPDVIAQLGSVTELNLRKCSLYELPQSISELKQLKILKLDHNSFWNGCPDVILELTSLTKLSLRNCHLTSLPPRFGELQQLEVLALDGNDFSNGLPDVIAELSSLAELHLHSCHLKDLPPRFGELQQLEILNLRVNSFTCGLPDVVGELSSLVELNLKGCSLTDLPPRFGKLQQLKVLLLWHNRFSNGLPEVIGDLSSLTKLDLEECSLTDLPKRFGELQQLEFLFLKKNDFSGGCPDAIGKLGSLIELDLKQCSLRDLPQSLDNLHRLRTLDLENNELKGIPSVVYELEELESLSVSYNRELVEMDKRILQLKNLERIGLLATSLRPPLGDVAERGLKMVKKYFVDLAKKSVISTIPVAIIGEAEAGKTSIRKSLITRERESIDRSTTGENATQVFEVEKLILETSEVNLIDFGGQDIYHVAYQLALKETCVPLLVVDMAKYEQRIDATGSAEEATKCLCMEWLCHLYVAQPKLDRPMLALTHIDQCRKEFEELKGTLLQNAKSIQQKWQKSEQTISGIDQKIDGNSERISCIEKLKFSTEDIFKFTNEKESSDIAKLTERIASRCLHKIPQNWSDVSDFLKSTEKPYINISDIDDTKFPDYRDILQYLHTTGAILWFDKKKGLDQYVFHRTEDVTNMVALLFPLNKEETKKKWLSCFMYGDCQDIGEVMYEKFVDNFLDKTPGMIDTALLHHLVMTQSAFKIAAEPAEELVVELAIKLLKCFHIIHGPIKLVDDIASRTVYLVPSIIKTPMDKSWETSGQLQLRLDLIFNGLPLPKHVYQLMTVKVLELKRGDEIVMAASNGGMLRHDDSCATYLVHDYDERKVIVQVSTNLGSLNDSWRRLKSTTEDLKSMLNEEWPACRVELKTYCTHCLFLRDPAPGSTPNPTWYTTNKTYSGLKPRKCLKSDASNHTVPTPLLLPCSNLDSTEVAELEGCLTKWQSEAFDVDVRQEVS